jgi:small-conductance mechanosensitive channel
MGEKFIRTQNLFNLLDPEPYFVLCALLLLAWGFYKLFLGDVSKERHQNLREHFNNIFRHFLIFSAAYAIFIFARQSQLDWIERSQPYIGLFAALWGMTVFVKTSRLIILQYLFLGSMRAGVPILIVNIFSLLLSIVLALWTANQIFGFQVAPLLATSAAFSIILGLAIQDTLGNLFAGISLQVDKSFEIGDWVEVLGGGQKTIGQVKEISWRATILAGLSEELITIPNRFLANAQISNFSDGSQPLIRYQLFRLSFDVDTQLAKRCLLDSVKDIPGVKTFPAPFCNISESNETGVGFKLGYFIDDYGLQWGIGDKVLDSALNFLLVNGITVTPPRIMVLKQP